MGREPLTVAGVGLVALMVAGSSAAAAERDRDVVQVVLKHFEKRSDTYFYDPGGVLLIWPETAKWIDGYTGLDALDGECPADGALYETLKKRNAGTRPTSDLLQPSSKWPFVKESEKATISPALPPAPDGPKRPPMKTMVTLHQPAFSASGDSALVTLRFVWSMHDAAARYLLRRSETGEWKVTCSKVLFYP